MKYVLNKKKITRFTSAYLVTSTLVSVAAAVMECTSRYRWYQLFLCIHIENCSYVHTFFAVSIHRSFNSAV
jgi:hypothetical protein